MSEKFFIITFSYLSHPLVLPQAWYVVVKGIGRSNQSNAAGLLPVCSVRHITAALVYSFSSSRVSNYRPVAAGPLHAGIKADRIVVADKCLVLVTFKISAYKRKKEEL